MVGRTRRKRKDPSDGLIDLFEIDLYTWARMVSEYRGWSIGPRDNFNEPDEIEDRDEGELREDLAE